MTSLATNRPDVTYSLKKLSVSPWPALIAVCQILRKTGARYDVLHRSLLNGVRRSDRQCTSTIGKQVQWNSRIRGAYWGWQPYR
jgi:hypothetical protein